MNPKKIKIIDDMQSPSIVKEVQCPTGRLATLLRFLCKVRDKCHPFFVTIKARKDFTWTKECKRAFIALKE